MKSIRINAPGDGDWIMERVQSVFRPGIDQVIMAHDGDTRAGGFVLNNYLGASIAVHMAGDKGWCSRDLLWMMFDYVFNQLHAAKLIAPCASDNHAVVSMDLRVGFTLEATIHDAYGPGRHLLALTMTRDKCRWLSVKSRRYKSGGLAS